MMPALLIHLYTLLNADDLKDRMCEAKVLFIKEFFFNILWIINSLNFSETFLGNRVNLKFWQIYVRILSKIT